MTHPVPFPLLRAIPDVWEENHRREPPRHRPRSPAPALVRPAGPSVLAAAILNRVPRKDRRRFLSVVRHQIVADGIAIPDAGRYPE